MAPAPLPTVVVWNCHKSQQAHATAKALARRGQFHVRALTDDPDAPGSSALASLGVQIYPVDATNRPAVERALTGARGLFFCGGGPAGENAQDPAREALEGTVAADCAFAAGVDHVVFSSVHHAEGESGARLLDVKSETEAYMKQRGLDLTVLRPVAFLEGLAAGDNIKEGEVRGLVDTNVYQGWVSVVDVGRAAATVFEKPDEYVGKEVELCAESLTGQELADTVASVRHQRTRYRRQPVSTWRLFGNADAAEIADFWQRFGREKVAATAPLKRLVGRPVSTKEWLVLNGYENKELSPALNSCSIM